MKTPLIIIALSIITFAMVLLIILLVLFIVGKNFKDTMTIPEKYCESSGGEWNFYECYNCYYNLTENPDYQKLGYWCDYPDGLPSKSEEDIEYIFNLTEWSLV